MLKYYWFCIRWLYHHRYWQSTRQKMKALDRDWEAYKYVMR